MSDKNTFALIMDSIPPINKEGHKFVFIFAGVSLFLWALYSPLGYLGLIATAWCAYFFRDPNRVVPTGESFVISPADGVVQKIEKVSPPEELGLEDEELTRVSIFLNVFDVHVNRAPIAGEVVALNYHPGQFLSANLDKASTENERQSVVIKTKNDQQIICVQIAGLVARRIICDLQEGQDVEAGERYGLIRFGSRTDIYLPKGVNPSVVVGQRAVGGETIIADLKSKAAARQGEVK